MCNIIYNTFQNKSLEMHLDSSFSGLNPDSDMPTMFSSLNLNSIITLIIIIICVTIIIYQYCVIQYKNRKLAKFILKLYGGLSHFGRKAVVRKEFSIVSSEKKASTAERIVAVKKRVEDCVNDKELFERFDEIVHFDKLYLNYNLGRDDYLRIMGVDKNKFGKIIKEYGGGNISTYLNNIRLEYSVELLCSDKNMTVNEVATQCAFPNAATFYRLFKEKYGVSPNKFRNK